MTNTRKVPSFADFKSDGLVSVSEGPDAILPVLHDPDQPDQDDDDSKIPNLFATIHFKSDQRPDGYTSKDLWEMNNNANAHLPHLQQEWPHGDAHEAPEDEESEVAK